MNNKIFRLPCRQLIEAYHFRAYSEFPGRLRRRTPAISNTKNPFHYLRRSVLTITLLRPKLETPISFVYCFRVLRTAFINNVFELLKFIESLQLRRNALFLIKLWQEIHQVENEFLKRSVRCTTHEQKP